MSRISELIKKIREEYRLRRDKLVNIDRFGAIAKEIESGESALSQDAGTVVVFNASTRLANFSLNAAFSLLSSWGLRLSGWRVIHFVCQGGMSRCVLGSSENHPYIQPPCKLCAAFSHHLYSGSEIAGFEYKRDEDLSNALVGKSVAEMMNFVFEDLPLGEIVLPSLRWRMRRHHLEEDETTLLLFREFILSTYHVGKEFAALADREKPDLVLVFNGQMFPEAIVRYLARQRGIKVISHETGYQPYTAFFTTEDATARKIYLTEEEKTLTEEENRRLDAYLEKRFQGSFSMAGVKFWQNMEGFPASIEEKLKTYEQVVPIFTNVIFDTSQAHANTAFEHMFAWLDAILEVVRAHPETLFVLRAHPDELRPNSTKKSKETVQDWVEETGAADLPNLIFIPPLQFVSSYDLIRQSKFVLAYNSSIALEAVLLGKLSVCAGWAWYSEYPVVISPQNAQEFTQKTAELLAAEQVELPEQFLQVARALVYYQNFRVSIPFDRYLGSHTLPGFVRLKSFDVAELNEQDDPAVQSLLAGIRSDLPVIKLERNYGN
ncbi:MAG: hypothetical protein JW757_05520 [Anaerolineales bacterium]|nr:hypothetical protein [Anaerolineales bacterium]